MTGEPFLTAHVVGRPVTQGSKKAFAVAGKDGGKPRAVMVDQLGAKLKPWRQDVRQAVMDQLGDHPPLIGPIRLSLAFALPKPLSAPKNRRIWPSGRVGDVDKLARAAMDAMSGAVYEDDCQICDLHVTKDYPSPENGQMTPGVMIAVWRIVPHVATEQPPGAPTERKDTLWP